MNKEKKKGKLISVLGTGNYTTVNYGEFDKCEYIQEALVRKYKNNLSEVIIFATEDAINTNWESNGEYYNNDLVLGIKKGDPKEGLKNKLRTIKEKYNITINIKMIKIPNGYSKEELWNIFNKFIDNIEEGDEIYFDITHSFRYLPMLVMNILNYAKLLKGINVKSIEYGLFEKLGRSNQVRELPLEERNADILDLSSFNYLNDWVIGLDNFINTGDADKISQLSGKPFYEMFSHDKDPQNNQLRIRIIKLKDVLKRFNDEIKTARGNLLNNTIIDILTLLDEIEPLKADSNNLISPFIKLIDKIKDKFSMFNKEDKKGIYNYFQLLKWCKEHKLVQQGLVIFRENMISMIADKLNEPYTAEHMKENNSEYTLVQIREEIGNAIYSLYEPEKERTFITDEKKFNHIRNEIENNFSEFLIIYNKFSDKRNDVSHFGFNESPIDKSQRIIKKFNEYINDLEKLLDKNNYL